MTTTFVMLAWLPMQSSCQLLLSGTHYRELSSIATLLLFLNLGSRHSSSLLPGVLSFHFSLAHRLAQHLWSYVSIIIASLSIRAERLCYWNVVHPSVGPHMCIVAKRLIASGCRLGWWVGWARHSCVRWKSTCLKGKGQFLAWFPAFFENSTV